jgi:DNA-binding transcriptional MerR regulator
MVGWMEYFDYEAASASGDAGESWEDIKELLEGSEQRQKERLAREVLLVGRQLERRDEIHEKSVDGIVLQIEQCVEELRQIYRGPFGGDESASKEVEERLAELYAELRDVYRQRWIDRQGLEGELREIIRRLNEVDDESISELI